MTFYFSVLECSPFNYNGNLKKILEKYTLISVYVEEVSQLFLINV